MKSLIYLNDIAHGKLIKQIAYEHGVSVSAVDKGLANAKHKLDAKTLCEAVYKAAKQGLICLLIFSMQSLEIDLVINPDHQGDIGRNRTKTKLYRTKKKEFDYI